jgi:hypothetical protein
MYLSEQDAAGVYARACLAWYRGRASDVVATKIQRLQKIGDRGGVKAWSQVAAQLAEFQRKRTYRPPKGLLGRQGPVRGDQFHPFPTSCQQPSNVVAAT